MRSIMSVLEGVLAIHKPPHISSFDVIRTVTPLFRQSPLFQPLIERQRSRQDGQRGDRRKPRRKAKLDELKIGHGGTLDPLATGVLVVGIGNGTKSLQNFLDGTKEYECTVLFGAATDSYDIVGKVTKTAAWDHVTKEKVEKALEGLRGEQMQLPPVYSSIRVDGKHLYEYARAGLPIPEIKRRKVTVHELELLEWLPTENHDFDLPSQEADAEAKLITERIAWPKSLMSKRKRESEERELDDVDREKKIARSSPPMDLEATMLKADVTGEYVPRSTDGETKADPQQDEAESDAQEDQTVADMLQESSATQAPSNLKSSDGPKPRPPAARLRMKVSSGFYVRSLCHDLGLAVQSAGLMATLVRARQSNFELGKNVIEYEAFEQGPEVWEPQVRKSLEEWMERKEGKSEGEKRAQERRNEGRKGRDRWEGRGSQRGRERKERERRRNSSSPEQGREGDVGW